MTESIEEDEDSSDVEISFHALTQLFKFLRSSEEMMELID
jgi:hypothetical protein